MAHLREESLFYRDVAKLIVKGAEDNKFMNLDSKAIKIMVSLLDLRLDEEE